MAIHICLKPLIFFVIFISSYETSYPINQLDTLWTKTFGGTNIDIGHSVTQTTDGGYAVTGYTRSFGTMSGRNVYLLKTDHSGNQQFLTAYGGNNDDEGYSLKQTSDGGFIIAGLTKSFGAGLNDVYVIKTNSTGDEVWSKTFGGAQDDEGYSVIESTSGGYVIAGVTSSYGSGSRDVWLIKTDNSGNELWRKTHGGFSSDGARDIKQTSDGGYIITGWTFSHGPGSIGNLWLVRTDSSGNELWNKAFGGTGVDRGYSVQQTNDGGFIIAGYTSSFGAGLDDMLLIKTDSNGNELWQKAFGGTGRDYGHSVIQTFDGGFLVAGYTLSFGAGGDDFWLVKTDASGNLEWHQTFGGTSSDVAYSISPTNDGGYIITGHTLSFGAGVHDIWLIKTATVIPVELINFSADIINSEVLLKWETASELNNHGFEVLYKIHYPEFIFQSDLENDWQNIGFVIGKGNSKDRSEYSFSHTTNRQGKYLYKLKQVDYDGSISFSKIVELEISDSPQNFELSQNHPNPFNPHTLIRYQIPLNPGKSDVTTLKVFDVIGNEVLTLVDEIKDPGSYEIYFNADKYDLASGIYFYKLKTGLYSSIKKMIYLK
jgi:regulation of enolase protein 1 (concanavalin A-like superfamily)